MNNIINILFQKINYKHLIIFILTSIMFGMLFNVYDGIRFPLIHEFILTFLSCTQTMAIKKLLVKMNNLKEITTEPIILGCISKYEKRQSSIVVIIIVLFMSAFFSFCIIKLNYLPLSPLGIYGGLLALTTLIIGLYGYIQFAVLLSLLYEISLRDFSSPNYPGHQEWYSILNVLSHYLSKCFLVFGVFYILEYYLLVPINAITIKNLSLTINTVDNNVFVISWISIIILIVLAFPLLVIIRKKLLRKILYNWEVRQISNIQTKTLKIMKIIVECENQSDIKNASNLIELYNNAQKTIKNIVNDTVLSNNVTIGVTTFLNIGITVVSLISQTKELFS